MEESLIQKAVIEYVEADKNYKAISGEYFSMCWGQVKFPKKILDHKGFERIKKAREEMQKSKRERLLLMGWPENYLI